MTITPSDLVEFLNQMAALNPAELQAMLDTWTLTPDQTDLLHRLADHFIGPQTSSPAPSSRSAPASNDPWKAFHRCSRLALHQGYLDLLNSGPCHFVTSYGDATIHDGCMSASRSAQQQSVQRLRELFIALALYDIVRSQFPRFSGNRLSDRMKDQVKSLLPQCDVIEQYRMGKNLDALCKRFGMGCVLYLAEYLSKDFLCNKFTASGEYHDRAFQHLDTLNLVQLAEDSRANDFASKARVLSLNYLKTRTSQS